MGDEYAAFHYLCHKEAPVVGRVQFVSGPKPLSFEELYSPRDKRNVLHKGEKSYWRTRDRIEYCLIEDRKMKLMVITCKNLETKETFRTIFLKLDVLYFEVEAKARGDRDALTKKSDKGLQDDKALHKAVVDYCLARLNIKAEPMPWPTSFVSADPNQTMTNIPVAGNVVVPIDITASAVPAPAATTPSERMCTFDKLSSDVYQELEVVCPSDFTPGEIENIKLQPSPLVPIPLTADVEETSLTTETTTTAAVVVVADVAAADVAVASSSASVPVSAAAPVAPAATTAASSSTTSKTNSSAPTSKTKTTATPPSATTTGKKGVAAVVATVPAKMAKALSSKKVVPL